MAGRISSLRLFTCVRRSGSFTAANKEVGGSQPSVSRIIATLEMGLAAVPAPRSKRGCLTKQVVGLRLRARDLAVQKSKAKTKRRRAQPIVRSRRAADKRVGEIRKRLGHKTWCNKLVPTTHAEVVSDDVEILLCRCRNMVPIQRQIT